jgi:TonB family protein
MNPAMLVKWEGGTPPDSGEWIKVLLQAFGKEAGLYWVRFYPESEGWRFDLQRRQAGGYDPADESVALHVYALLIQSGRPLDPGWKPFAPSPPAATTPTPEPVAPPAAPPVADSVPAPSGEASAAAAEGDLATGRRRGRRRRNRNRPPPPPVQETKAESLAATWEASAPEPAPESPPEPPPRPETPAATPRAAGWRRLRPAIVYLPAVLMVALAGWLSRDRLYPRPAPSPVPSAPSPSVAASQEPPAAEKQVKEPESIVGQLQQERVQVPPGRRPAAPGPIGGPPQASKRRPTPPAERPGDEAIAPTPTPGPTPTPLTPPGAAPADAPSPADAPLPADLPVSTDEAVSAAPVPAAAPEPPPTPPPVQRGAMVDLNDPDVTRPVLLTQTRLRYPPLALERRLAGTVWLNALVDETGAVAEVTLVRASPRGLDFEDAATRHARTRVYRPATKQGVPVRVWVPLVVEFRLPGR